MICCCVFWACAARAEAPVVLLLGDSLSAAYGIPRESSWPELLRQRLAALEPPHTLLNASISGETSAGGLRRFQELQEELQPSLLLLELGGNDGLRGLPLDALRANLEKMILGMQGKPVLLFEMRIPSNYGPRYTDGFTAIYAALAQEHENVVLLPFFLGPIALEPEWFLEDGIHPNEKAQPLLLEPVWAALQPLLQGAAATP